MKKEYVLLNVSSNTQSELQQNKSGFPTAIVLPQVLGFLLLRLGKKWRED
jgi:hypothetical protein